MVNVCLDSCRSMSRMFADDLWIDIDHWLIKVTGLAWEFDDYLEINCLNLIPTMAMLNILEVIQ